MKRTVKSLALVAVGAMLVSVLVWAADNPLKNAKVGEWIEFVIHTQTMGQTMDTKMKQTVIAKDAVSVTLRNVTTVMGKEMSNDTKIMFDQPYEPYKMPNSDAVVTPLGEGNETITVGGKPYNCHWVKVKVVTTKPQAMEGTTKVWSCKDVPVNNMVKMETESAMKMGDKVMNTTMTMELVGSGK